MSTFGGNTAHAYPFWMIDVDEEIESDEKLRVAYRDLVGNYDILLQLFIELCNSNGGTYIIPQVTDDAYMTTGIEVEDKRLLGVEIQNVDKLAPMRPLTLRLIKREEK